MRELIIHIGFSKCASSSIQGFLTSNPTLNCRDGDMSYLCFDKTGELMSADAIQAREKTPMGYINTDLSRDGSVLKNQLQQMARYCGKDGRGIISNEGLANPRWMTPEAASILEESGIPLKIFLVVRPFHQWLNAGWWQWGIWRGSNSSADKWVENFRPAIYETGLGQWTTLKTVDSYQVIDISQNPVDAFTSFVEANVELATPSKNINQSSSADVLRFLLKNKALFGRTEHAPAVEFFINSKLTVRGPPPPFVVPSGAVLKASEYFSGGGADFLDLLRSKGADDGSLEQYTQCPPEAMLTSPFRLDEFLAQPYQPEFMQQILNLLPELSVNFLLPTLGGKASSLLRG